MKEIGMTDIVPFNFEGNNVRAFELSGEIWFVAKDAAVALGYSNPQKAVRDHCKRARPMGVNDSFTLSKTTIDPLAVVIPEPDLYRLIMRSRLPSAEKFEALVVEEILPSIRKTGQYSTEQQLPTKMDHREVREVRLLFQRCTGIAKSAGLTGNQMLMSANTATRKMTGTDLLAAMGLDKMVSPTQAPDLTPTDIGKRLGNLSSRQVNEALCQMGFQVRHRSGSGKIYYEATDKGIHVGAVYKDTGKRHGDGTPVKQLQWASGIVDVLRGGMTPPPLRLVRR
jgi:prophage antirepressor-like protein